MSVTTSSFRPAPSHRGGPLLAFLTFWPFIYIAAFFLMVVPGSLGGQVPFFLHAGPAGALAFFAVHLGTILVGLGSTVFYIVHAAKNPRLATDDKIMWVALIVLFTMFAYPVYWWRHVRQG